MKLLLPLSFAFLLGVFTSVLIPVLFVIWLRRWAIRTQAQEQACAEYWRAELGVIEPPSPAEFSTQMNNWECLDYEL